MTMELSVLGPRVLSTVLDQEGLEVLHGPAHPAGLVLTSDVADDHILGPMTEGGMDPVLRMRDCPVVDHELTPTWKYSTNLVCERLALSSRSNLRERSLTL